MEREKVQELLEYATTLYGSNISIEDIEKAMMKQGADEELAKKIVRTACYIRQARFFFVVYFIYSFVRLILGLHYMIVYLCLEIETIN